MSTATAAALPAASTGKFSLGTLLKNRDLFFTFALFGTVVLLVLPVPAMLLDVLLALSIGMSLLILLVIIYVEDPSEFSGFPTLLLAVTLYRLALNVASTRLILLDGHAGEVIQSFGSFVVRGNYVVGTVIFFILVVINFMVITKGAGRIAEVAARFTLDAMPGKQMAIDAELNAGAIDEPTARARRRKVQGEADFYGAMDGASKFVRGDAIAGILITFINVVGGFGIGILQKGLPVTEALQKYTLLSIGDGLVSQVPALIVSVAAGLLVTRASDNTNLGTSLVRQLGMQPRAVGIACSMMFVFAIVPGLPAAPFMLLGSVGVGISYLMRKHAKAAAAKAAAPAAKALPGAPTVGKDGKPQPIAGSTQDLQQLIDTETFAIELGYGLVRLADRASNGDLLDRITGVRKSFARDMGIIVPPIAVRDSVEIDASDYRFLLRTKQVAKGQLMSNRWLAMNVAGSPVKVKGVPTVEPVFGIDAVWIDAPEKTVAEMNGYSVVDAPSVLITHLSETLKQHAWLMLSRQDVQTLIDHIKATHSALISELLPDMVNIGIIQRVLQNLLKEGIPIKNLTVILECIADFAPMTKNPDDLSEQVRKRLGTYFISQFESSPGIVKAITLDPRLEQALVSRVQKSQFEVGLSLDPTIAHHLLNELNRRCTEMIEGGFTPIIMITAEARLAFKRFFETSLPKLAVLSYHELPPQTEIQNFAIITPPAQQIAQAPQMQAA
ncbi:MAG: flagellar biosynthesis protein FlhA [Chthoniobacteraceae bacterium]